MAFRLRRFADAIRRRGCHAAAAIVIGLNASRAEKERACQRHAMPALKAGEEVINRIKISMSICARISFLARNTTSRAIIAARRLA